MKVLLAPLITCEKACYAHWLTANLASLFYANGITCGVVTDKKGVFRHVSFYPSFTFRPKLFNDPAGARTCEEWLFAQGALDYETMFLDVSCILEAMEHFAPDLVIAIDRPGAVIAASYAGVPSYTVVNSVLYRKRSFPDKVMRGVNRTLSDYGLEQVLNLKELYARCDRRIGFGPVEAQPFVRKAKTNRIGLMAVNPARASRTNRLCIFFSRTGQSPYEIHRLIREAFHGAPYAVNTWYPGAAPDVENNIRTHASMKPELVVGSMAVIHDGNAYLANLCMGLGIPQLIIAQHGFPSGDMALAASRYKYGICLYEEKLTMASLYETYRRLVCSEEYENGARAVKQSTAACGDLSGILDFLCPPRN